jgi:hypothetical protein
LQKKAGVTKNSIAKQLALKAKMQAILAANKKK